MKKIQKKKEQEQKKNEQKLKDCQKDLLRLLINLFKINSKIGEIGLNKNNVKNPDDYINQLGEMIRDDNRDKELKEIKNFYKSFLKNQNIDMDDLKKMSDCEINQKIDKYLK